MQKLYIKMYIKICLCANLYSTKGKGLALHWIIVKLSEYEIDHEYDLPKYFMLALMMTMMAVTSLKSFEATHHQMFNYYTPIKMIFYICISMTLKQLNIRIILFLVIIFKNFNLWNFRIIRLFRIIVKDNLKLLQLYENNCCPTLKPQMTFYYVWFYLSVMI